MQYSPAVRKAEQHRERKVAQGKAAHQGAGQGTPTKRGDDLMGGRPSTAHQLSPSAVRQQHVGSTDHHVADSTNMFEQLSMLSPVKLVQSLGTTRTKVPPRSAVSVGTRARSAQPGKRGSPADDSSSLPLPFVEGGKPISSHESFPDSLLNEAAAVGDDDRMSSNMLQQRKEMRQDFGWFEKKQQVKPRPVTTDKEKPDLTVGPTAYEIQEMKKQLQAAQLKLAHAEAEVHQSKVHQKNLAQQLRKERQNAAKLQDKLSHEGFDDDGQNPQESPRATGMGDDEENDAQRDGHQPQQQEDAPEGDKAANDEHAENMFEMAARRLMEEREVVRKAFGFSESTTFESCCDYRNFDQMRTMYVKACQSFVDEKKNRMYGGGGGGDGGYGSLSSKRVASFRQTGRGLRHNSTHSDVDGSEEGSPLLRKNSSMTNVTPGSVGVMRREVEELQKEMQVICVANDERALRLRKLQTVAQKGATQVVSFSESVIQNITTVKSMLLGVDKLEVDVMGDCLDAILDNVTKSCGALEPISEYNPHTRDGGFTKETIAKVSSAAEVQKRRLVGSLKGKHGDTLMLNIYKEEMEALRRKIRDKVYTLPNSKEVQTSVSIPPKSIVDVVSRDISDVTQFDEMEMSERGGSSVAHISKNCTPPVLRHLITAINIITSSFMAMLFGDIHRIPGRCSSPHEMVSELEKMLADGTVIVGTGKQRHVVSNSTCIDTNEEDDGSGAHHQQQQFHYRTGGLFEQSTLPMTAMLENPSEFELPTVLTRDDEKDLKENVEMAAKLLDVANLWHQVVEGAKVRKCSKFIQLVRGSHVMMRHFLETNETHLVKRKLKDGVYQVEKLTRYIELVLNKKRAAIQEKQEARFLLAHAKHLSEVEGESARVNWKGAMWLYKHRKLCNLVAAGLSSSPEAVGKIASNRLGDMFFVHQRDKQHYLTTLKYNALALWDQLFVSLRHSAALCRAAEVDIDILETVGPITQRLLGDCAKRVGHLLDVENQSPHRASSASSSATPSRPQTGNLKMIKNSENVVVVSSALLRKI